MPERWVQSGLERGREETLRERAIEKARLVADVLKCGACRSPFVVSLVCSEDASPPLVDCALKEGVRL